jgi:hypothetical protein
MAPPQNWWRSSSTEDTRSTALKHLPILDRPGVEARVCECYETVEKEYRRLLE